jgi:hypothetical protein
LGGAISVANGAAFLTSDGTVIPCVRSAENPFPASGDFALIFNMTFTSLGTYGDGLWVSKGLFSPEGWLENESSIPAKNSTNQNIIQVWGGEVVTYVAFFGNTVFEPQLNWRPGGLHSTDPMVFRLEYTKGVYSLYLNNVWLASEESQLRPDTIAFGSPPLYYLPTSGPGHWSSIKIDSIAIVPTSRLSIETSTDSTNIGLTIDVNGNLTDANDLPLSGTLMVLSYLMSGVPNWAPFASVTTDSNGAFSSTWLPVATGNFSIKAEWAGNETSPGTFDTKNISVYHEAGQPLLFVESNSTLSSLAFNSSSSELFFTVSGPSGTSGYVRFLISKSILPDASNLLLYVDDQQTPYNVSSAGGSWLVYFGYHHSEHDVRMQFTALHSPSPTPQVPEFSADLAFAALASALAILVALKKRAAGKKTG